MNIYNLTRYLNQEVDDSFTELEVARWFNKAIAAYNLLPPLTVYPTVALTVSDLQDATYYDYPQTTADEADDTHADYIEPLDDTFILAVILPYLAASVKGQEASIYEKAEIMKEFQANAMQYKQSFTPPDEWRRDIDNTDLDEYQLGENVFVSDFTTSPFAGNWSSVTRFTQIVIPEEE